MLHHSARASHAELIDRDRCENSQGSQCYDIQKENAEDDRGNRRLSSLAFFDGYEASVNGFGNGTLHKSLPELIGYVTNIWSMIMRRK
jgi:hypothetical protein